MTAVADIPVSPDDVDARWLTGVLAERYPGVRVSGVEVAARDEVTNVHAVLHLAYERPAGAPSTMFCKLAPRGARRAAVLATGMGRREALFYASLAASVPMRVLDVHAARHDESTGDFVLLLEDLASSGCRVSDGTWGLSADAAAAALEELAAFHATHSDPRRRAARTPWIPVLGPGSGYASDRLRYGMDHHRDRLTASFVRIAELYIAHQAWLHELWHDGPATVIHGDPHIGNIFLDGDRVGFLDWGVINVGSPMRDVSYLLTMAMAPEDRRPAERERSRPKRRRSGGSSRMPSWRGRRPAWTTST